MSIRFKTTTEFVIEWIERMQKKHGSVVYEKNRYQWWDWGQALCREQYGENWNDVVPSDPTWDDVRRAKEWENGDIPKWVDTERMTVCGEK